MQFIWALMLCGLLAAGCSASKQVSNGGNGKVGRAGATGGTTSTNAGLLVTPASQISGRVASVNPLARFVIATFPLGTMPSIDQKLNVYRDGLKVAVIKVTGPQRDVNIAADIIAGECRVGDDIKND